MLSEARYRVHDISAHPLVLGAGLRLFGDGGPPASLRLVDSTVSTTGVLIATYQPEQLD